MNLKSILLIAVIGPLAAGLTAQTTAPMARVPVEQRIAKGVIRGYVKSRLRMFKGVPYAAPPLGPLRWRPPEPVAPWSGVLDCGPTAMRHNDGSNEDCLYLNIWMPEGIPHPDMPVMVWLGDMDGGPISIQGVLFVGFDYRRGIFGFLPLPGLAAESGRGASGNYGFMDMIALLRWVRDNIAFFGGDPGNVTLVGTGDAADAVSAAMISPEARGLFCRAIAGSGGLVSIPGHPMPALADAESAAAEFCESAFGTSSSAALRVLPARALFDAARKPQAPRFGLIVDGALLPGDLRAIFAAGKQARVPLMAGWNPACDEFAGYSAWKLLELSRQGGAAPLYAYSFEQRPPPVLPSALPGGALPESPDTEDPYVLLSFKKYPLAWTADDKALALMMAGYWTNFAKTGNPNVAGLPNWPAYLAGDGFQVMRLTPHPAAVPGLGRARYRAIDRSE